MKPGSAPTGASRGRQRDGSARTDAPRIAPAIALEQLVREVAYAARVLRRSPGVTLLSVATMGVGIGVSALLFTLVDGIVLRPLPYPEPDRLVRIFDTNPQAGIERTGAASGNIDDWRDRAGAFDGVARILRDGPDGQRRWRCRGDHHRASEPGLLRSLG